MDVSVCRICLRKEEGAEGMRSIYAYDTSRTTLQFKLHTLGFLQVDSEAGFPSFLCNWCVSRVDDAFSLKKLCDQSKESLLQMQYKSVVQDASVATKKLDSASKEIFKEKSAISVLSNQSTRPGLLNIISGTKDMVTSIQSLCSTLLFSMALLRSAVYWSENIMFTLLGPQDPRRDSMLFLEKTSMYRHEAEAWKIKCDILADAAGFVKMISHCNGDLNHVPLPPSQNCVVEGKSGGAPNTCPSSSPAKPQLSHQDIMRKVEPDVTENLAKESESHSQKYDVTENLAKESESRSQKYDVKEKRSEEDIKSTVKEENYEEESISPSCRRSYRSRTTTQPLMYWPQYSFKKRPRHSTDSSANLLDKLLVEASASVKENVTDVKHNQDQEIKQKNTTELNPLEVNKENSLRRSKKVSLGLNGKAREGVVTKARIKPIKPGASQVVGHKRKASSPKNKSSSFTPSPVKNSTIKGVSNKGTSSPSPNSKEAKSNERHACSLCSRVLKNKESLELHSRIHTGNRLYSCSICGKQFNTKSCWITHEQSHTGSKPVVCKLCKREYLHKQSLKYHMAVQHNTVN